MSRRELGLGSGGLAHPGMLLPGRGMLQSPGCVGDPARFPRGLELGLDLAAMPWGLGDTFQGTRCRGAGLGGTASPWAQRGVHWGTEGTGGHLKASEEQSEGLFPWDVPLPCLGDAGMAPAGGWAPGLGPAASQAMPRVPVPSTRPPVYQLPGSGGGGGSGDMALSHTGGHG